VFSLDVNGVEIVVRTMIVYLALLFALRVAGKREMGQMTSFDLVVLLLISEAVQGSMVGEDMSVTGGLIAAGILIGGNYGLAQARDRIPFLRAALESSPTVVVSNGRFMRRNMRDENLEEDEVMLAIRAHGIEDVKGVRLAVLEQDGSISVIPAEDKPDKQRRPRGLKGR
jgi:uncharacterized membrane protein YcaP (DUF421 family)